MKAIATEIASCQNLTGLQKRLDVESLHEAILWLSRFTDFLINYRYKDLLYSDKNPIIPNQRNIFKSKESLVDDQIDDDDLKDIAFLLGYDCRADITHPSIQLEFTENQKLDKEFIAGKIVQMLSPKLVPNREEDIKKAARKLLIWISEHPHEAETFFPDYFKNRHVLYDNEDMTEITRKAQNYEQIIALIDNQEDVSEDDIVKFLKRKNLKKILEENHEDEEQEELKNPESILISLSITNLKQYNFIMEDPRMAKYFRHTSTPTSEMFVLAHEKIKRAKLNVRKYLDEHSEYNCDNWDEENSLTVIKGVTKHIFEAPDAKRKMLIIIRPTDGGKVIFHYPDEFDAMATLDHELWGDDGHHLPRPITPGELFRKNRINRLDV